jgi:polyhydroxyalkanoate synthase
MAAIRYRQGRARLRAYGGTGRAIIVVPSLINPPFILDLTRRQSLLRWLADRGHRVFLLDWGSPDASARAMDVAAHVERLLMPLMRRFAEPPVLVGYCLGGTMAIAAACAGSAAGLATIATPWRFSGFGPQAKAEMAALWASARPYCDDMGLVPMEVLQSGFWQLDPARTIAKYEAFAAMDPASDAARNFVALEDWANAGAPLPYATGREMFEDFIAADLPGRGQWRVKGQYVDPARLECPTIDFVSTTDRIVPAATASGIANRHDLNAGHVGMIVGSKARSQLWEPLADWLSAIPVPR